MEQAGLGAILDYAAEADVSAEKGGTGHSSENNIENSNNIKEYNKVITKY